VEIENYNSNKFLISMIKKEGKPNDEITFEENIQTYNFIVNQLKKEMYVNFTIGNYYQKLIDCKPAFINLNIRMQAYVLSEMMHLIQCNNTNSNLSLILDKASNLGGNKINKNITFKNIKIIDQSITGFYERIRWSNKNVI